MNRSSFSGLPLAGVVAALFLFSVAHAQERAKDAAQAPIKDAAPSALRVCADPNNLPFSNRKGEGFENKIAELFGKEMGVPVEYTWYPQRFGFIRNTLRARVPEKNGYKCDLIIGVPAGYGETATTRPYFTSTYAMAFVEGRGLDDVKSQEDVLKLPPERLKKLKFGIFAQTPPVDWLLKNQLMEQAIPYQKQSGDPEQSTWGVVEKDLIEGRIDVAFVWGPIGGYFAKQDQGAKIAIVPMHAVPGSRVQFGYPIAMGVRQADKDLKARLDKMIAGNQGKIDQILDDYGVPRADAGK
ncbi:MAG: substrate-binding domain-containing protein [Burkholderiales bacterium]|nr:quinoprotein dehydrogenase-associated putative ABC transporter substrate-binding protein [Burkholderiales bacterium]MDQ3195857.1 substrate-binding domain-containing protein [Pseudomonadota bacterium]